MTCREWSGLLVEREAHALLPAREAAFVAHLARCLECVAYLAAFQAAVRGTRAAFEDDAADDRVPEELVRAIVAASPPRCPA